MNNFYLLIYSWNIFEKSILDFKTNTNLIYKHWLKIIY